MFLYCTSSWEHVCGYVLMTDGQLSLGREVVVGDVLHKGRVAPQ